MTVSAQIIEVLNALCEKAGIAIDWTSENILPYLQELAGKFVAFEYSTSIAWILLVVIPTLIFCGLTIFCAIKEGKTNDPNSCWSEAAAVCFFASAVGIIISAIVVTTQIFDLIACKTLPEKILLEQIQIMMRSIK